MNQKQKGWIGLGAMAVLAGVTIWGSDPIYRAVKSLEEGKKAALSFVPGTYTGTAEGYGGEITAVVTVSEKRIEYIEVTGDDETDGLGSRAVEEMPPVMVEEQSVKVDGITSATISSTAVREAVKAALDQAEAE